MNYLAHSLRPVRYAAVLTRPSIIRPLTRSYSTAEEVKQKFKLPIFRRGDPEGDAVTVGKLREDQHSVAVCKLEFIKIEDVLSMSPEELNSVVVVPKTEKVNSTQRLEKLESTVERLTKLVEDLSHKINPTTSRPRPL